MGLGLEWGSLVTSGSRQRHDPRMDALGVLTDDMGVYPWPSSFAAC